MTDATILSKGMDCLIQNLGDVDAERFIMQIIREPFDYTKWQKGLFEGMSLDDIGDQAVAFCKDNPR
jgi:hypothetical protein